MYKDSVTPLSKNVLSTCSHMCSQNIQDIRILYSSVLVPDSPWMMSLNTKIVTFIPYPKQHQLRFDRICVMFSLFSLSGIPILHIFHLCNYPIILGYCLLFLSFYLFFLFFNLENFYLHIFNLPDYFLGHGHSTDELMKDSAHFH